MNGSTETRRDHWERLYASQSPFEVSWYQEDPALSLALIGDTRVAKDAPLIDVGGGDSLLVDRLLALGFSRVAVLDVSGAALDRARRRLGEHAEAVEWFESDVTEFVPPHTFAVWHDRATLHFLTSASDREEYVEVLKRSLSADGHVIIATFAVGGPRTCSGLEVVQYDAERVCRLLGEEFRLAEQRSEVHRTPAGVEQKFAYFRFMRTTGAKHIDELLDEALEETFPASDPTAVTPAFGSPTSPHAARLASARPLA